MANASITVLSCNSVAAASLLILQFESVQYYLRNFVVIPIGVVNVLGNLLSIVIYSREKFRKISFGFYMIIMSLFGILQTYSSVASFYELTAYIRMSEFTCRFHFYWERTSPLYVPWISVLVCLDRVLTIWSVRSRKLAENNRFKVVITVVLILALSALNVGYLTNYMVVYRGQNYCIIKSIHIIKASYFIDIIGMTFLPFTTMLISNILVSYKLFISKRHSNTSTDRTTRFASLSITLNVAFFVIYIPFCIVQIIITSYIDHMSISGLQDCYKEFILVILNCAAYILRSLYTTIQVFIYICVNSLYRQYLVAFLKRLRPLSIIRR